VLGLGFLSLQRRVLGFRAQNVSGPRVLVLAKKGFTVLGSKCILGFRVLVLAKKGFTVLGSKCLRV